MSAVLNHISTHMEDKFYWPDPPFRGKPSEAQEVECPYCKGVNTEFEGFVDDAETVECHVCYDCEIEFMVEVEIPF